MATAYWTQYRAIVQTGYIDIDLDSVLSDNEGWTDFQTAYEQYKNYKATGMNTKIQKRKVIFGNVNVDEIERTNNA